MTGYVLIAVPIVEFKALMVVTHNYPKITVITLTVITLVMHMSVR